jgi:Ca-activated chloride channel family protein
MRITAIMAGGLLGAVLFLPLRQGPPTIRAEANLVQVYAAVRDGSGRNVSGLGKDAFELLVDGVPHPITVFQSEDAPVTAGIVIDNSASMGPKRLEVISAALAFARASNPRDQMFVVHFNDHARFGLPESVPFTGDISELERAVSEFQLGGTTALYDALLLAMTRFESAAYTRHVLLVITDGGDNSSKASLEDAVSAARKHAAAIFAIGIFDPKDPYRNPDALTQAGEATGGAALFPSKLQDVRPDCEHIAREIRQQYTLGFPGAEDGQYHRIELRVRDSRYGPLTVETRAGYFAPKP